VAVTVTLALLLTVGALNRPLVETLPAEELQVTALLLDPLTAAVNCTLPAEPRLVLVGEIVMVTLELGLVAAMVISGCTLTVVPCASVPLTQKYFVTATVGVPLIMPVVELRARPIGSVPSDTANL